MPENNEEKSPVSFEQALQAAREQLEQANPEQPEAQAQQAQQTQQEGGDENPEDGGNPQPQDNPPDARTMYLQQSQQMAQMQQQMGVLMEQNRQLQEALSEQSRAREAEVIETAQVSDAPPRLDLSNAWAEDEETLRERGDAYSRDMAEYMQKQIMSRLEPYLATMRSEAAENEKRTAIQGLSQVKGFEGIGDEKIRPALERIIAENPILSSSDAEIGDKLAMAYTIARGAEAIRTPQRELSDDDFMARYQNSPELQKRVEMTRAQGARGVQNTTPPMSAGSGNASVPLSPPQDKPESFEDARNYIISRLKLNA